MKIRACCGLAVVVTTALIAGCATAPQPASQPPATPSGAQSTPGPSITRTPAGGDAANAANTQAETAVGALMRQAATQQRSGKLEQAASSLERGLRIAPRDAALWQRLAELRLAQGNSQQAEIMADRSNDFANGNKQLQQRNWRIIAEARGQQGNETGAQQARQQADDL